MLNRLSSNSMRVRVGIAVAVCAGAIASLFFGWGIISAIVAAIAGSIGAWKILPTAHPK